MGGRPRHGSHKHLRRGMLAPLSALAAAVLLLVAGFRATRNLSRPKRQEVHMEVVLPEEGGGGRSSGALAHLSAEGLLRLAGVLDDAAPAGGARDSSRQPGGPGAAAAAAAVDDDDDEEEDDDEQQGEGGEEEEGEEVGGSAARPGSSGGRQQDVPSAAAPQQQRGAKKQEERGQAEERAEEQGQQQQPEEQEGGNGGGAREDRQPPEEGVDGEREQGEQQQEEQQQEEQQQEEVPQQQEEQQQEGAGAPVKLQQQHALRPEQLGQQDVAAQLQQQQQQQQQQQGKAGTPGAEQQQGGQQGREGAGEGGDQQYGEGGDAGQQQGGESEGRQGEEEGAQQQQPPAQPEQEQEQEGLPAQRPQQEQEATGAAPAAAGSEASHKRQQRCAVVNNRNVHLDVAAGIAWAFQEAGCNVTTYLAGSAEQTNGLHEVMGGWFRGDHRDVLALTNETALYDAFILVTFPETHSQLLEQLLTKALPGRPDARRRQQRVLAVVHNPRRLLSRKLVRRLVRNRALHLVDRTAWEAEAGEAGRAAAAAAAAGAAAGEAAAESPPLPPRLQLLSLSPATGAWARQLVEQWALHTSGVAGLLHLPWLPPLAPWRPSFCSVDIRLAEDSVFDAPDSALRHLCIQGILDPKRRDYSAAIEALAHPAVLAQLQARNESLLLLGHEAKLPLTIPVHMAPYVRAISSLPYQEYYDTLSRCRAILPAFASDVYLINKTSSTVATAINVGSPLLAEERLQSAYTFLPKEVLFTYAAPSNATPIDVAALATEAAQQYIQSTRRLATVTLQAEERVAEALAWLRAQGVALPADMMGKVAAEEAAEAQGAGAEDADGEEAEDAEEEGEEGEEEGDGEEDEEKGEEVEEEGPPSEAQRWQDQLPALQQAAEAAAAAPHSGPEAELGWRQLAVQLLQLAHTARRRQLLGVAAPQQQQEGEQVSHEQQAGEEGTPPLQQRQQVPGAQGTATVAAAPAAAAAPGAPGQVAQPGQPPLPPEGSYAAALLRTFEPGAAQAAHAAARRLKSELMERNRQVAADFLAGAARLAAQVEAEEAAKQAQQQAEQQLGHQAEQQLGHQAEQGQAAKEQQQAQQQQAAKERGQQQAVQ